MRARGLVKTFRSPSGPVRAVRGVDISIAAGETVALLGPNGAGKTTTIDMLLGLSRPDGGEVALFGGPPAAAVRAGGVGAMLQTGGLIRDLTVRELIGMMAALYPHPLDADEVLELAGLRGVADQRTQKLSGGQTQRARFAMALVGDPGLLVLDEPTVALDVEARRTFWITVRRFTARGKTVLFATHYLDEADANADRVVLLAAGRVVADGPPTEIKARVGSRTIKATLPDVPEAALAQLPGVTSVQRHGEVAILVCSDSDAAIRELLRRHPQARDIEITGAGLEEAFLRLTGADDGDGYDGDGVDGGSSGDERLEAYRVSSLAPLSPGVRDRTGYLRYELLRIMRNRRFFIFAIGFPLGLYFLIAGPNRNVDDFLGTGLSAPLYYMVSLAAFGTMSAMLSTGTRIAAERDNGWNRRCGPRRWRRAPTSAPRSRPPI